MRFPYGETVTVLREVRNRVGDVTLVEDFTVSDCVWSPSAQGETNDVSNAERGGVGTQTITGRTLYLPPGSGVTAVHRVRFVDGSVWEVVGEVGPWRSPWTGWAPGDQVDLRRVRG